MNDSSGLLLLLLFFFNLTLSLERKWWGENNFQKEKTQKPSKTKQKLQKSGQPHKGLSSLLDGDISEGVCQLSPNMCTFHIEQRSDLNFLWFWRAQQETSNDPRETAFDSLKRRKCPSARTFWKLNGPLSQVVSPLSLEVFKTDQGMWSYISFYHIYNKGCYIGLLLLRKVWMLGLGGQIILLHDKNH